MKSRIVITAKVEAVIEHEADEDITQRDVDIYIWGEGEQGHIDKENVGIDWHHIKVLNHEERN